MKAVMITAPRSGCGKTTVTMGIIRALKNIGKKVCAFKTGPDYIDRAFLEEASGMQAGNLDIYLQGVNGMREALSLANGDYAIIEGAMGYFDGIYNTYINSSYEISEQLDVPAILVYTPKGEMFSAVPKIKGMVEFENSRIKAVILNKVSRKNYLLLKEQIERYMGLQVIGFIPPMDEVVLKSRHLGLVQSFELDRLDKTIEIIAAAVVENVDMNALQNIMSEIYFQSSVELRKRPITVAVAKDKAFSFYYRENIYMLENSCQVVYFSPIADEELPPCDLVYLGGGYPEVYSEELTLNTSMLVDIKRYVANGGFIYAECGGFMYLCESIEGARMAGVLRGECRMTGKLQRFGYIDIELEEDCMLGNAGDCLTAHEFHKSTALVDGDTVYSIKKVMGENKWNCGYRYKNVLAGYPHIHFLGNRKAFECLLDIVEGGKACILRNQKK